MLLDWLTAPYWLYLSTNRLLFFALRFSSPRRRHVEPTTHTEELTASFKRFLPSIDLFRRFRLLLCCTIHSTCICCCWCECCMRVFCCCSFPAYTHSFAHTNAIFLVQTTAYDLLVDRTRLHADQSDRNKCTHTHTRARTRRSAVMSNVLFFSLTNTKIHALMYLWARVETDHLKSDRFASENVVLSLFRSM